MNGVHLVGRIASQIEAREVETQRGRRLVAAFLVAVRRPVRDASEPEWLRVETWGVHAENLTRFCAKGSPVALSGHLRGQFVRVEGQTREQLRVAVVAESITFLGRRPSDDSSDAAPAASAAEDVDGP